MAPIVATGRALGLGRAADAGPPGARDAGDARHAVTCGEDEFCAGQHVRARDGDGGHFRGLAVGPDGRITGLLVDVGRLPLRRRVLVPAGAISSLGGTIRLALSCDELRSLAEGGGGSGR